MRGQVLCRRDQGAGRGHKSGGCSNRGDSSEGKRGEIRFGGDQRGPSCLNRGGQLQNGRGAIS